MGIINIFKFVQFVHTIQENHKKLKNGECQSYFVTPYSALVLENPQLWIPPLVTLHDNLYFSC